MLTMQGFLAAEEEGDSLDAVEALMKKHDNFEKSLEAQEEKFKVSAPSSKVVCGLTITMHCTIGTDPPLSNTLSRLLMTMPLR